MTSHKVKSSSSVAVQAVPMSSPELGQDGELWQLRPSVVSGPWSLVVSPTLWVKVISLAAIWFATIWSISWWTEGNLPLQTYPWVIWMDRLWFGILAFLLSTRVLEQYFLLTRDPMWPFPVMEHTKHFQLQLPAQTTLDLQQMLQQHHLKPARPHTEVYWFEHGTLHAWGGWFVALALFLMVLSLCVSPYWPSFQLATRVSLFCTPWLFLGILLRWGSPHRVLALSQHNNVIEIWGYSEHGWLELTRDIHKMQQLVLSATQSPSSSPVLPSS